MIILSPVVLDDSNIGYIANTKWSNYLIDFCLKPNRKLFGTGDYLFFVTGKKTEGANDTSKKNQASHKANFSSNIHNGQ